MSLCADDSGDEGSVPQGDRALTQGVLKTLATKLDDLSTCNELIGKHGAALQRSLNELEELRGCADNNDRVKAANERATLFRITSNAMINVSPPRPHRAAAGQKPVCIFSWRCPASQACRDFVDVADSYSRRWQKALQYEKEQRHHLEETIEQLAKQHNSLERAWREKPSSYTGESHLPARLGDILPSCGL